MTQHYLFAGSFCPPTYGHLAVLQQAARMFPFVTVVCSRDVSKTNWFSQEECAEMWQAYDLPENVEVVTYEEQKKKRISGDEITLVRGIRNGSDYATEQRVIELNSKKFGITSYVYILATDAMVHISASAARKAAQDVDLTLLASCVAPAIVTKLLEVARMFKSLNMVVGQPAGGKSTFCQVLMKESSDITWINSDDIGYSLRDEIEKHFGEDLVKVAIEKSQELADLIGEKWLERLAYKLRQVGPRQHVFVEVAYGLQADKRLQRFLGNKVVYIGCEENVQRTRVIARGTPEHEPFFEVIPNLNETREIANREKLQLIEIDTSGSIELLKKKALGLIMQVEGE